MLVSLQYLRAVAALAVVLFHYRDTYVAGGGEPSVAALFDWGHAGVPVFFVLAGFIMVWTTKLSTSPRIFLWHRVARIYGGYLPIAVGFLAYKGLTVGVDYWVPEGLNLAGSLLLIEPNAARLLIFPTWSLTFELMFYAAFAGAISLGPKAFFWLAPSMGFTLYAFGAIYAVNAVGFIPDQATWPLTSGLNILFFLGVLAGIGAINGIHLHSEAFIFFIVISLTALGFGFSLGEDQRTLQRIATFGIGSSALILVLLRMENFGRVRSIRVFRTLGDASFAIYLLHIPLKFVLAFSGFSSIITYYLGANGMLFVYLGLLLLISVLYYSVVENPLNKAARRLFAQSQEIKSS